MKLIDLQEAGSRARVLGVRAHENPYLEPHRMHTDGTVALADWLARHDAWKFGWEAEDASREGRIVNHFKDLISTAKRRAFDA
ncbi:MULTISPECIES: CrpP-related protein [Rhizobium]|uniref:CrpP-related protein n=1 Tax=Rhizobium TaxID=379 RepID=UPI001FE02BCF|nr:MULTISPECIES: CrpP-related protein [Rhizobium]